MNSQLTQNTCFATNLAFVRSIIYWILHIKVYMSPIEWIMKTMGQAFMRATLHLCVWLLLLIFFAHTWKDLAKMHTTDHLKFRKCNLSVGGIVVL